MRTSHVLLTRMRQVALLSSAYGKCHSPFKQMTFKRAIHDLSFRPIVLATRGIAQERINLHIIAHRSVILSRVVSPQVQHCAAKWLTLRETQSVTAQFPSRLYPGRGTKSLAGKSRSREAVGK